MPDVSTILGYVAQIMQAFNLAPYLGLLVALFIIAAVFRMFR